MKTILNFRIPVSHADAQIIIAEIDEAAGALAGCYKELSKPAKASAIKLGHSLGSLRKRMCGWTGRKS